MDRPAGSGRRVRRQRGPQPLSTIGESARSLGWLDAERTTQRGLCAAKPLVRGQDDQSSITTANRLLPKLVKGAAPNERPLSSWPTIVADEVSNLLGLEDRVPLLVVSHRGLDRLDRFTTCVRRP